MYLSPLKSNYNTLCPGAPTRSTSTLGASNGFFHTPNFTNLKMELFPDLPNPPNHQLDANIDFIGLNIDQE